MNDYKKFYEILGYQTSLTKSNQNIQDQKLKILKSKLKVLKCLPFIDSIYLSGSVGFGFPQKSSDIDLFVVAKKNKIWSARFFSHLILRFFKLSRRDGDENTKDKFCLNHFITTESLKSSSKNIFQAFKYAHLIKIFANPKTNELLFEENKSWIKNFIPDYDKNFMSNYIKLVFSESSQNILIEIQNTPLVPLKARMKGKSSPEGGAGSVHIPPRMELGGALKTILQILFFWLEPIAKSLQARKIRSNTNFNPENIQISDKELKFHPENKEKELCKIYSDS